MLAQEKVLSCVPHFHLQSKYAFKNTEHAEGEPKKRNNSVVVAKTLDHTQAEEEINFALHIQSEGRPCARGVSDSGENQNS